MNITCNIDSSCTVSELLQNIQYIETHRAVALAGCQSLGICIHHPTDAPSTGSFFNLPVQFFHWAYGIEAFCQQNDLIQEETWCTSIDDIKHQLYSVKRFQVVTLMAWWTGDFGLWREAVRVGDILWQPVRGAAGRHPYPDYQNLGPSSKVGNLPRQGRSFLWVGPCWTFRTY